VWASPERAFFAKEKKELYDLDGTLIYPIMTIDRSSINKNLAQKGKFWGNPGNFLTPFNGGRIVVARRIVADKTNNFAIAENRKKFNGSYRTPYRQSYFPSENKKVVFETLSIPQPVYVMIDYKVTFTSNYQQQINDMTQPFISLGGHINSFLIKREVHAYEVFMKGEIGQKNNLASYDKDTKVYNTTVSFDVLGYLIGEGPNQERPKVIKRQNAVKVKIPRERVIMGDVPDYEVNSANSPFYRD